MTVYIILMAISFLITGFGIGWILAIGYYENEEIKKMRGGKSEDVYKSNRTRAKI